MTNGPRCRTNKRLRIECSNHVKEIPLGQEFKSDTIARKMNSKLVSVDARSIGRFLSEFQENPDFPNVRKIGNGIWRRVPA